MILSNVEEVIEQKPAEKENRREQWQDDKYLILFYASEAMSLDLCYSHIRAGDRCAIYAHIICILRMIVLEGCRFEFIWVQKKYNFSILEGLVSLSPYCF